MTDIKTEIRGRALDVGAQAREVAREAGNRARLAAADQLGKASKAVEPNRTHGLGRYWRLLLVPVVVAVAVFAGRTLRARAAAQTRDAGDAADREAGTQPGRPTRKGGTGNGATEVASSGRGAQRSTG